MARLRSCRVSLSNKERKIIRHLQKKATSSNARTQYAILLAADENKHKSIPSNSDLAEYIRNGTVSIFCFIQPHTGRILHSVEETRTAVDWAEKIRVLVDEAK